MSRMAQATWLLHRSTWETALTTLRRAMELIGIFVCVTNQVGLNTHRSLNHEEFRGFVLIDEYAPWVFVNSNDTKSAQMFTLAHEMVHVWLGKPGLFNLVKFDVAEDDNERYCNKGWRTILICSSSNLRSQLFSRQLAQSTKNLYSLTALFRCERYLTQSANVDSMPSSTVNEASERPRFQMFYPNFCLESAKP